MNALIEPSLVSPDASIYDLENLHAWEVAPYDTEGRSPAQRAALLRELGITRYAYLSTRDPLGKFPDPTTTHLDIDSEIEAMLAYDIEVLAWYFWVNHDQPAEDPLVQRTLAAFRRYGITPRIWVAEANPPEPAPRAPDDEVDRVRREADRIGSFLAAAADAGCALDIYNHRGWFGVLDNQLRIVEELDRRGVARVGMVYNFSHSRDSEHDDAADFPSLWERVRHRVTAVNVTGISEKGDTALYVGEGDSEIEMIRVIRDSGWRGNVGILIDKVGDSRVTLGTSIAALSRALGGLR